MEEIVCAMEHMPRTKAGAAFIERALNPCGEDPAPFFTGIPDSSGNDATPLEFRDDFILESPVSDEDPEEQAQIIIFNTPYFMVHYIAIRFFGSGPSQANLRDTVNALTATQQDNAARYPNWFTPVSVFNPTGTALIPYTGPSFEITFMVPAALQTFTCNAVNISNSWTWFRKWRYAYKGSTMHLNAPGLANQGRVISASTATESSIKNVAFATGLTPVAARFSVTPPFADNILAQQDANAHQDLAKKGEYTIQRHANEAIILNEAEDVRAIWRVASAVTSGGGGVGQVALDASYLKVDGFDMNLGWIVQNIRGISQQASIHLKTRSCIAVNVPGDSPWAPVLKPSIQKDQPALTLYRELAAKLPHSFVSDYNDWGLLSKVIFSAIRKIGVPLARRGLEKGFRFVNDALGEFEGSTEQMPFNASRGGYGGRRFTAA